MKYLVKKGATSYLTHIFIQDSSSTTGAGLTGLTSGSSGLVCYRARTDDGNAGATQITLSAGTKGTWSSGGFVEKDATNMPGIYEFGITDASLASGSNQVVVMFKGATNMAPCVLEIQLVNFDPTDGVHLGLTCLPNTAVTTNASLITSGTSTDQLSVTSGKVDAGKINGVSTSSVTTVNANIGTTQPLNFTGTAGSALVKGDAIDINSVAASSVTTINANLGTTQPINHTGTAGSALVKSDMVDVAGAAVSTSSAQIGVNAVNWAGGAIPAVNVTGVPLVDLKYTLGTISPATAGSVRADQVTGAVGSVTGAVGSVTGNVGGNVTGSVGSVVGAVGSVTGNVGGNVVGSVGSLTTNNDKTGYALTSGERTSIADALLDRDMSTGTDSGSPSVRTVRQALRFLRNKWAVVTGTLTVYKEDDTTSSWTSTVGTDATAIPIVSNDPA